jgi:opacity protein-like surface antigen
MKNAALLIATLLIAVTPALAEDKAPPPLSRVSLGTYLSYWHADDLSDFDGEGFIGGGVNGQLRLLDFLALELRAGVFGAGHSADVFRAGDGWFENETVLVAIPLEAGLVATLKLGDTFHLYGGPGAGYYVFDGEFRSTQGPWKQIYDLEFDDETGCYALFGARWQLARNAALFAEAKYTWVETRLQQDRGALVEQIRHADFPLAQDIDLEGFSLQAGFLFTF